MGFVNGSVEDSGRGGSSGVSGSGRGFWGLGPRRRGSSFGRWSFKYPELPWPELAGLLPFVIIFLGDVGRIVRLSLSWCRRKNTDTSSDDFSGYNHCCGVTGMVAKSPDRS